MKGNIRVKAKEMVFNQQKGRRKANSLSLEGRRFGSFSFSWYRSFPYLGIFGYQINRSTWDLVGLITFVTRVNCLEFILESTRQFALPFFVSGNRNSTFHLFIVRFSKLEIKHGGKGNRQRSSLDVGRSCVEHIQSRCKGRVELLSTDTQFTAG
jgi:hypothetical protein